MRCSKPERQKHQLNYSVFTCLAQNASYFTSHIGLLVLSAFSICMWKMHVVGNHVKILFYEITFHNTPDSGIFVLSTVTAFNLHYRRIFEGVKDWSI